MSGFLDKLREQVLIGDGAMGTMLAEQGLGRGESPELWMLAHPEEIKKIHCSYLEAGSQVIQTNTFGANRLKLGEYGASDKVALINKKAARLAREAAGKKAFVAGIVGPTGHFPAPLGDIEWSELVDVFGEQVTALAEGGVDFIFLETFSDLGEIRAALFAAKTMTSLPVACSMTYSGGRTLTGTSPEIAATVLSSLGAQLIGANCSTGSRELLEVMKSYRAATRLPLLVEPNAGMPELIGGKTVFRDTPEFMASYAEAFRQAGVNLIGACCGSTPRHIEAIAKALTSRQPVFPPSTSTPVTRLASRSCLVSLGPGCLPVLIGERINPTARSAVAGALRKGNWAFIVQEATAQVEAGAQLLDFNVGVPGLEEDSLLKDGVQQLQQALDVPLVLDCTRPEALEKGLREFQGRALINSVNGEEKSLSAILPLAKKYGAAVIGLCLDEKGIPESAKQRLAIAERIVNRAFEHGLAREDVLIDCLTLTAATSPAQAMETIRAVSLVKKDLRVAVVLGLSNISHGLPQRSWLNAAFLALALGAGLDAVIANPADSRITETLAAASLLAGRDKGAQNYLSVAGRAVSLPLQAPPPGKKEDISLDHLQSLVFHGQVETIVPLLKKLLETEEPLSIINRGVIPPLEKMGDLFARGEVFLPQLMLAGGAAKQALAFLKKHLPAQASGNKGTVVIGTVKGDIHDIGKNITAAMLENHGYRVIDLGKNVPGEKFLAAAIQEKAGIVGLSALMTTTMVEMGPIIRMIKKADSRIKVIVGGAVVTEEYARSIGADGYGKDAVAAVKLVQSLFKEIENIEA
ncbi:MAG: homocysteine S-methyltransferase family protein [Peptococcaceae bacterium]|nr:homocysteine S-methyltransferase family protein [Peptococcaceae bacterium]MDH7525532.1 homocysteine S-methyltransferase family protein [Peptococcaceae bacterium]